MKIIYNLNVIIIAKFILFKFYGRMGDGRWRFGRFDPISQSPGRLGDGDLGGLVAL